MSGPRREGRALAAAAWDGDGGAEAERDSRYARLRAAMAADGLDGLLAYAPAWRRENVRYLTGASLQGSFAFAYLPRSGSPAAFVARAADAAAIADAGFVDDVRPLAELAGRVRAQRLGVAHAELVPHALHEALPAAHVSATALMDRVRLVKSEWEIAQLRRCAELCDAGWDAFVQALAPGRAEYEIVAEVEAALKAAGAEDNFMIIASGGAEVRGMTPPSDRRLQPGDMVRTELTPQRNGYWAQICRTAVLGAPTPKQRDSFALFEEATRAGLGALRAGVTAHDVANAENDVFRARGYGEYTTSEYTRVRGHGHGLHFDEVPIVEGNDAVLEERAVVIVHPNTYTPLAGYHVLGDPVVVTRDGAEPLLATPRELTQI